MDTSNMTLKDWLDDLSVRFIVNLPKEELESVERILFQIEEAQWFYEDFVRPLDAHLPSLNLKQFCMLIFQQCSLFAGWDQELYSQAFSEFLTYKTRVPVRGAIMLNAAMDQCVLVKGWKKSANWSFPRGKINKGEPDLTCAIREVYEETGFDIQEAGLVPEDESQVKSIEITMREQHMKLFVFHNVPMETHFQPRTRKEISSIQWYRLTDLPTLKKNPKHNQHQQEGQGENLATNANKFYMVAPFMSHLKKYIAGVRKRSSKQQEGLQPISVQDPVIADAADVAQGDEAATEAEAALFGASTSTGFTDMDRLMNQLRQSQQVPRDQTFPEVVPGPTVQDSSEQIRAILNIPQNQANLAADAPSLLHLLQQPSANASFPLGTAGFHIAPSPNPLQQFINRSQTHNQMPPQQQLSPHAHMHYGHIQGFPPNLQRPIPQTPIEQIYDQPSIPASPKRLHQTPSGIAVGPPPVFPLSPQHAQQGNTQQRGHGAAAGLPTQTQRHIPVTQSLAHNTNSRPTYRGDTDPVFGSTRQSAPSVPEPSKLPPPKLNATSSKLLSLFKAGSQAPAEMSGEPSSGIEPPSSKPSVAPGPTISRAAQAEATQRPLAPTPLSIVAGSDALLTPALASPAEIGPSSPAASRPRTSQQNALLDLFKSQPSRASSGAGRASGTLSPALAPGPPPAPAIDLSATPSLAHGAPTVDNGRSRSREALAPAPRIGGKITIQKRPAHHTPNASMSATVSGPLNITEQDLQKVSPATAMTPGSVKILSRPGTASGSAVAKALETSPQTASPKQGRSPRRRQENKQARNPPKPFQPQILKRPADNIVGKTDKDLSITTQPMSAPQILRRETEAPSPMSSRTSGVGNEPVSAITPAPVEAFDHRTSQSSEQKAMLLSLFQKPGLERPAVSPLGSLPRTRLGSLASTASGEGGRVTPQTSEKDKKFLLGFLNNVVNESR